MVADVRRSNLFQDKENGLIKRVDSVDASYAKITVLGPLQSTAAIPLSIYDVTWMRDHNVVDAGDMVLPDAYRPPANALVEPEPEPEPEFDADRGEGEEGVTIDAPSVPLGI